MLLYVTESRLKGGGKSWPLHHEEFRRDVIKLLEDIENSAFAGAATAILVGQSCGAWACSSLICPGRARTPRARLCRLLTAASAPLRRL